MQFIIFDAWSLTLMLVTKFVTATSACIIHWLALGTSCATPTAPMALGVELSDIGIHPGAALVGKDSAPALTVSPLGASPPDTFGVQSVAFCCEPPGCDVGPPGEALLGALPVDGPAWSDLL
jgi:hypothetical protein